MLFVCASTYCVILNTDDNSFQTYKDNLYNGGIILRLVIGVLVCSL